MTPVFQVLKPGLLDTVQDLGRPGRQAEGMVVAGAMDGYALVCGNLLLGNSRHAAGLEFAQRGPTLRVLRDALIVLTGAPMGGELDRRPVQMWRSQFVRVGQLLEFKGPAQGAWSYLCMAGGIEVPQVMGSRSTYLRAGIGGVSGRTLRAGDELCSGSPNPAACEGRSLAPRDIPVQRQEIEVRAVPGPQDDYFTALAVEDFFSTPYTVTAQSDRMGYRLQGKALDFKDRTEILTDAVAAGAVQVPANGQPIVLLADRQTTGGYAKVATVISADLPKFVQLLPGGKVSFRRCSVETAQDLAGAAEALLIRLGAACGVCG